MDEEIAKAVEVMKNGGTILYPSDTIWGVGCDATNSRAVQKLINIKNRPLLSSFIILIEKEERLKEYVAEIPGILWDLLSGIEAPTTIIYPKAKNLPKNVIGSDKSVAIRLIRDEFCKKLIEKLNKPVVSSSANFSGLKAPLMFKDISEEFKRKVDYIVDYNQKKLNKVKPSTIIKLNLNGTFEIIRQ